VNENRPSSRYDSSSGTSPSHSRIESSLLFVTNNDQVTFLGFDPNRSLCVIPPPPQRDDDMEMIRQINQIFSQSSMRTWMTGVAKQGKDPSICLIQSIALKSLCAMLRTRDRTFGMKCCNNHRRRCL